MHLKVISDYYVLFKHNCAECTKSRLYLIQLFLFSLKQVILGSFSCRPYSVYTSLKLDVLGLSLNATQLI